MIRKMEGEKGEVKQPRIEEMKDDEYANAVHLSRVKLLLFLVESRVL